MEMSCKSLSTIFDEFSSTATQQNDDDRDNDAKIGIFLLYASWNTDVSNASFHVAPMSSLLIDFDTKLQDHVKYEFAALCVDQSDDEMECLIGDNINGRNSNTHNNNHNQIPCPPEQLPCILLLMKRPTCKRPEVRYLSTFKPDQITRWILGRSATVPAGAAMTTTKSTITGPHKAAKQELKMYLGDFGFLMPPNSLLHEIGPSRNRSNDHSGEGGGAIRIFVAGDRMSVGKTSVCLGLLGSLIQTGYSPERLAYIKPATQNEKPQLVQHYCERLGIPCVSIGPIVYYRGFTRSFLAGETESSSELLHKVGVAVDALAQDKDVVVVDGVGFPAVGSICGTDNASVAIASSYPELSSSVDGSTSVVTGRKPMGVLIVGGPGVGGAVDAFNLNATYFEQSKVPVLGAIFNKLSLDGFYSLENCKAAITSYFAQNEHQIRNERQPFGFIPLFPQLGGSKAMDHVFEYIRVFKDHVDVISLLHAAHAVRQRSTTTMNNDSGKNHSLLATNEMNQSYMKRQKVDGGHIERKFRSRDEIEQSAIQAGAAPSA
jgi:AAA domain